MRFNPIPMFDGYDFHFLRSSCKQSLQVFITLLIFFNTAHQKSEMRIIFAVNRLFIEEIKNSLVVRRFFAVDIDGLDAFLELKKSLVQMYK